MTQERGDRRGHHGQKSGLIFGSLIVLIGALSLLGALDALGPYEPWDFWPLGLIFFGVVNLFTPRDAPHKLLGGMLIAAGLIFQANKLELISVSMSIIWPIFLIGFGVYVLWSASSRRAGDEEFDRESPDVVSEMAVFGGAKSANRSKDFKGGEALAIFGGCDLDLTRAEIRGDQAVIYARALFGGVDIRVPEDWDVVIRGVGILGGYEDKTRHPGNGGEGPAPKQLVVKGYAMFGGVDLKN